MLIGKDKHYYKVIIRKHCIRDKIIIDLIIHDISKIKKYEIINAENNYKQKILSKISHEFKTPMNSIIGIIKEVDQYITNPSTNIFHEKLKVIHL